MIKADIQQLMQKITQVSFDTAIKDYPNLSSFAIVTDEDLTCFDIAINDDLFFADVIAGKATDEDFWNTAEWTEELFCEKIPSLWADLNLVNELTDQLSHQLYDDTQAVPNLRREFDTDYDKIFLESCYQALARLRTPQNQNITLFIHVTDSDFHQELFDIVEKLNDKKVSDYYLSYH